jgi:hypothetical protein
MHGKNPYLFELVDLAAKVFCRDLVQHVITLFTMLLTLTPHT